MNLELIREKVMSAVTDIFSQSGEHCKDYYIVIDTDTEEVETMHVASLHGTSIQGENLFVISVEQAQIVNYYDTVFRAELTDEQKRYCSAKGWDSMFQSSSKNPADWEEFTFDDLDWETEFGELVDEKLAPLFESEA